ncbi:MAG: hypothetical protein ACLPTF_00605 [Steroidobacteraceae bacterium]
MPGIVTVLTQAKVSGFALHPYLQSYPVVVHVVHQTRILCSSVADQPPSSGDDEQSNSWFHISLSDHKLTASEVQKLSLIIGETDEILDSSRIAPSADGSNKSIISVEEIIYANVRRHWVTGATYIEGIYAGLSDADIIDLFYRDILGRAADPEGLSNYLFQRREGIRSLADIRKSLFDSEEYSRRPKEAAWAPGAIFSQPISMLAATAGVEPEDVSAATPEEPPERTVPAPPAPIDWPSYPERHVSITAHKRPEILEVALPVESVLFGSGWHNVEYLNEKAFRWMETSGVIFSPKPELPCQDISVRLAAVYGAHMPMIDCYLDDALANVSVEERDEGFWVKISPATPDAKPYTKLRIESRASGCPVQEDRGTDQRVLSLNVLGVTIAYKALDSSSG